MSEFHDARPHVRIMKLYKLFALLLIGLVALSGCSADKLQNADRGAENGLKTASSSKRMRLFLNTSKKITIHLYIDVA